MIDTPFKALADAYTAMRLERDHLKARIATLEAALRDLMPVLEQDLDEAIIQHGTYSTRDFAASMAAARAALALPVEPVASAAPASGGCERCGGTGSIFMGDNRAGNACACPACGTGRGGK